MRRRLPLAFLLANLGLGALAACAAKAPAIQANGETDIEGADGGADASGAAGDGGTTGDGGGDVPTGPLGSFPTNPGTAGETSAIDVTVEPDAVPADASMIFVDAKGVRTVISPLRTYRIEGVTLPYDMSVTTPTVPFPETSAALGVTAKSHTFKAPPAGLGRSFQYTKLAVEFTPSLCADGCSAHVLAWSGRPGQRGASSDLIKDPKRALTANGLQSVPFEYRYVSDVADVPTAADDDATVAVLVRSEARPLEVEFGTATIRTMPDGQVRTTTLALRKYDAAPLEVRLPAPPGNLPLSSATLMLRLGTTGTILHAVALGTSKLFVPDVPGATFDMFRNDVDPTLTGINRRLFTSSKRFAAQANVVTLEAEAPLQLTGPRAAAETLKVASDAITFAPTMAAGNGSITLRPKTDESVPWRLNVPLTFPLARLELQRLSALAPRALEGDYTLEINGGRTGKDAELLLKASDTITLPITLVP